MEAWSRGMRHQTTRVILAPRLKLAYRNEGGGGTCAPAAVCIEFDWRDCEGGTAPVPSQTAELARPTVHCCSRTHRRA